MTEKSKRCQELAKRVLSVYASWPGVRATTIGGSVARGVSDPCSDVDLFVFCESLPSEEASREAAILLGGNWWQQQIRANGSARRDLFGFEDERLDVEHVLIGRVESELDRVLVNHEWTKQQFVGGFYDCIPVTGHVVANGWIDRVRAYPDGLQTAMIEQHLIIYPLWIHMNIIRVATTSFLRRRRTSRR